MARIGLYVPLDVNFPDDDKVLACSAEAQLVYIRSLLLAKRFQSDGLIRRTQLCRLTEGFVEQHDDDWLVKQLVNCGLWVEHDEGWVIVAFTEHNPTSADLAESRVKEAERKRAARASARKQTPQEPRPKMSARTKPDAERVRHSESDSESESESDSESENNFAAPPKTATRARDLIFESLAEACGIDWNRISNSERGALNRAAAELRPLAPEPGEIRRRAGNYRAHFDRAALTPLALARHWGKCEHPPSSGGSAVLERLRNRVDIIDVETRSAS